MRSFARDNLQARPTKIEKSFNREHGSVLINQGNTMVLCTASINQGTPRFLRDKPMGWLTAEYSMIPSATENRTERESVKGKQQGRTIEIQRLIGRSLRSCLNLRDIAGYTITIDCEVLKADGGTRSAAICGSFVALVDIIQHYQYKGLIKKDPVIGTVTAISTGYVKNKLMIDLDYKEDQSADSDINIVLNDKNELIEIQGTAERKAFKISELNDIIESAIPAINEIRRKQMQAIGQPDFA